MHTAYTHLSMNEIHTVIIAWVEQHELLWKADQRKINVYTVHDVMYAKCL